MGVWAATLNKSEKGFEDAGDVERITRRTKAVKRNRRRRDMENPRCGAPGTKLSRDLGHNAAQLRQCGGFILARKVPQSRSCRPAKAFTNHPPLHGGLLIRSFAK